MGTTASAFELSEIEVVDNHCHALEKDQGQRTVERWRGYFSESEDSPNSAQVTAETPYYRRLTQRMAAFFGVTPVEEQVLECRASLSAEDLAKQLFADAKIGGLVLDLGFPDPSQSMAMEGLVAKGRYGGLIRLELLFQRLIQEASSLEELLGWVHVELCDLRSLGYVGMKSIAGYRTGLDIKRWPLNAVLSSFRQARSEVEQTGSVRLGHKSLLDTMLHIALAEASTQELPVQFHVGYGDRDVDLRSASPLHLRSLLEDSAYGGMKLVLLHGCWPYFREGAFLTSVYPNAYLDISFGIPYLSMGEMRSVARAVLGSAPHSKVMYSSDGAMVPEIFWMSAHDGRAIITSVLTEMINDGEFSPAGAQRTAEMILAQNAIELYELKA